MAKKRKPRVEIVPAWHHPPARADAASLTRLVDALVERRLKEIFAADKGMLFGSFFGSRRLAAEIRRLGSCTDLQRWHAYFSKWGCVGCRRKRGIYAANGFCVTCFSRVNGRLHAIEKQLAASALNAAEVAAEIDALDLPIRTAQKLLRGYDDFKEGK
jgi:hypothetical protein